VKKEKRIFWGENESVMHNKTKISNDPCIEIENTLKLEVYVSHGNIKNIKSCLA
jgi:hypothetical protein